MSKIKKMGASPLTGNIYYGTVDMEKSRYVGKKTDVTNMACEAVAEHLFHTQKSKVYRLKAECEFNIHRNQSCVMQFIPEGKK